MSAPSPTRAPFASGRPAQVALAVFVLCVVGLVAYRTYFPRLNAARPTEELTTSPAAKPIDLNTADRGELEQLPGVGPSMVDAIMTHRRDVGPFTSVDDLHAVHGVGDKTLAKLRPLVTVSEPSTEKLERKKPDTPAPATSAGKAQPGERKIDVNTATEAELTRLPRVGPATAKAIVAARPYKSVDDLDRAKGIGAKTVEALRPFVTVGE